MSEPSSTYRFRLYLTGGSPRSVRAVANLCRLGDRHLRGDYELEVIDLLLHPDRASDDDIIALPTLVITAPGPTRRLIGDLRDDARVLAALDLPTAE